MHLVGYAATNRQHQFFASIATSNALQALLGTMSGMHCTAGSASEYWCQLQCACNLLRLREAHAPRQNGFLPVLFGSGVSSVRPGGMHSSADALAYLSAAAAARHNSHHAHSLVYTQPFRFASTACMPSEGILGQLHKQCVVCMPPSVRLYIRWHTRQNCAVLYCTPCAVQNPGHGWACGQL